MMNSTLPHVVKVKTTVAVGDMEAFDMMARFLEAEKAKDQLENDLAGQAFASTSSSQTWNDVRRACNSLLDINHNIQREPVAAWKEDPPPDAVKMEDFASPDAMMTKIKEEESPEVTPDVTDKKAKKAAKKAKKEAKKAKKEAKKAKKEKKEKKRKREGED